MDIILIQRKGKKLSPDAAQPIWLACLIEKMPLLEKIWPLYQRRFAVDHWNRFAITKVTLDSAKTLHS